MKSYKHKSYKSDCGNNVDDNNKKPLLSLSEAKKLMESIKNFDIQKKPNDDNDADKQTNSKITSGKEGIIGSDCLIDNFRLSDSTKAILRTNNIITLTEIQCRTFDLIFDGYDLIGRARTGTGKTLAFVLPVIERYFIQNIDFNLKLSSNQRERRLPSVLCLLPTRELCKQVYSDALKFSDSDKKFIPACIYGGESMATQISALTRSVDFVVATPGRAIDMLNRNFLKLDNLKLFILDEADQMLELGFRENVEFIYDAIKSSQDDSSLTSPQSVQYLLFSATLPSWIYSISKRFIDESRKKVVDVVSQEIEEQSEGIVHLAMRCIFSNRAKILSRIITAYCPQPDSRCIIFTETKQIANDLCMNSSVSHLSQVLHGDVVQKQREITLGAFRSGKFKCLIATDVAARGLHIDNVDLVIQIDLPRDVNTYIHRSGRTGRAGKSGISIVFYNPDDADFIQSIEAVGNMKFKRIGVPQIESIYESIGKSICHKFSAEKVPETALSKFTEISELLIGQLGGVEAVCRCLFELTNDRIGTDSNLSNDVVISCLSGKSGYKTFKIIFHNIKIERPAYIWKELKATFHHLTSMIERMSNMTLLEDGSGAAFDLPSEDIKSLQTAFKELKNAPFELSVVEELPELVEFISNGQMNGNPKSCNVKNQNHRWSNRINDRKVFKNSRSNSGRVKSLNRNNTRSFRS